MHNARPFTGPADASIPQRAALRIGQPRPGIWLSVLVPAYNVEKYLRRCILSFLKDMPDGVEIIIRDDASTDATWALMQQLQAEAPAVVRAVASAHNMGLSGTRNQLARMAGGSYLWFFDSDDWIEPGVLHKMRALLQGELIDVLNFDFAEVSDDAQGGEVRRGHKRSTFDGCARQTLHDQGLILSGLFKCGRFFAWARVIHRRCSAQGPEFPAGQFFEDTATLPATIAHAYTFHHVDEAWVNYLQRPQSIMRTLDERKIEDLARAPASMGLALLGTALDPEAAHQRADFAARMYRGACRQAAKNGVALEGARLQRWRAWFELAAGQPMSTLLQRCLLRGQWGRWIRYGCWWRWPQAASWFDRVKRARRLRRAGPAPGH